ncbi:hypothetical protein DEO72_LG11g1849 [Vigna unguiculata]|uniref:Uncharacterized protein n=1 Tax=Vigna unguiculata TaxID=3917 RepID=A0A4D6NM01_VIGUN|nr:hypothetical protein DEO72_LG11g1849 [Vigna unguiculata]
MLQQQNCLAGDTYRQALPASRPLGRGCIPPSAKRLKALTDSSTAWRDCPHRQAHPRSRSFAYCLSPGG